MKWLILFLSFFISTAGLANSETFARFKIDDVISYGKVTEDNIQAIDKTPFDNHKLVGKIHKLEQVELLTPTKPQKVFAVGMNFASHISSPSDEAPPLFLKLPSSLIASNNNVVLPKDAKNVHFEGELVLVIGKQTKNVNLEQAKTAIFGVTVGNDLTERSWQGRDLQWMRAKATDGFGPIGSMIKTGINYNNVVLTTKLNGKIVQQESTSHMIHSPAKVVSYLSQYFTLEAGDLIYMGTPGRTKALNNGDVVSVNIENVGTVVNTIIQQ